jgi:hypothetical protein
MMGVGISDAEPSGTAANVAQISVCVRTSSHTLYDDAVSTSAYIVDD